MKRILLPILITMAAGCASTGPVALAPNDGRDCARNFTQEGSIVTGKVYRTSIYLEGTGKKRAFSNISKGLAMQGWNISNSDSELGMLNANQSVAMSNGGTAPLNISVDDTSSGSEVSLAFSTGMGVYSPPNAVMEEFCKIVSVANK
ncbi:hypothetical protein [Zhongshania borealis]|uniref:Lipoprotein n=1 Tax=Zhongshania borealis TaxID=889488 RepID=A0ABP7WR61_9GAMM